MSVCRKQTCRCFSCRKAWNHRARHIALNMGAGAKCAQKLSQNKDQKNKAAAFSKKKRRKAKKIALNHNNSKRFVAAGEGFEPSHTESESAVLPLHNPAKRKAIIHSFLDLSSIIFPNCVHRKQRLYRGVPGRHLCNSRPADPHRHRSCVPRDPARSFAENRHKRCS